MSLLNIVESPFVKLLNEFNSWRRWCSSAAREKSPAL